MPAAKSEDEDEEEVHVAAKKTSPREIFVERLQDINRFVMNIVDDDAINTRGLNFDFEDEESKRAFKQELRVYVPRVVLSGNWKDTSWKDVLKSQRRAAVVPILDSGSKKQKKKEVG